jgi:hypothetical protein
VRYAHLGQRLVYGPQFVDQMRSLIDDPATPISVVHGESASYLYPTAPDCHQALQGIARQFRVTDKTIGAAIKELGDALGEAPIYRFGPRRVPGYSPWQQNMIFDRLVARGAYTPKAPADYMNIDRMEVIHGISNWTLKQAIEQLGDTLGDVPFFKFTKNDTDNRYVRTRGYSPDQQQRIVSVAEHIEAARPANNRSPFSAWVFNMREATGTRQSDLADMLGVSVSHLAHFSSPKAKLPSIEVSRKLVSVFATASNLDGEAKDAFMHENLSIVETFYQS